MSETSGHRQKTRHAGGDTGIDVSVAGHDDQRPLPEVTRAAQVGEYTVTLDGELLPGEASDLKLTASRNGRPVTDPQPHLAAYGHLMALRVGDLGYHPHVHPNGEPGDGTTEPGPEIAFMAAAPSSGTYRPYLDFQHDDVVRTAEFTVRTTGTGGEGHHGGHRHH